MMTKLILLLATVCYSPAYSESTGGLTSEGKERLRKNLETLNQNSLDTQHNLDVSKTNLLTLETELRELDKIQEDHHALDNKYQELAATTQRESEKNERALRDLASYEEKARKIPPASRAPNYQQQLETSRQERENRQNWKKNAEERQQKLKQSRNQIHTNLQQVAVRRSAIQRQVTLWKSKEKSYQQMLTDIKNRRDEAERVSRNSKTTP